MYVRHFKRAQEAPSKHLFVVTIISLTSSIPYLVMRLQEWHIPSRNWEPHSGQLLCFFPNLL